VATHVTWCQAPGINLLSGVASPRIVSRRRSAEARRCRRPTPPRRPSNAAKPPAKASRSAAFLLAGLRHLHPHAEMSAATSLFPFSEIAAWSSPRRRPLCRAAHRRAPQPAASLSTLPVSGALAPLIIAARFDTPEHRRPSSLPSLLCAQVFGVRATASFCRSSPPCLDKRHAGRRPSAAPRPELTAPALHFIEPPSA
jgi:hypothetical protein